MKLDLRKPCIVTPLDISSLEKLNKGVYDNVKCKYFSLNRSELYKIFSTGFFDQLNKNYDLFISDYEHENITDKKTLTDILNNDIKEFKDLRHKAFWKDFENFIKIAIEKETGIFLLF